MCGITPEDERWTAIRIDPRDNVAVALTELTDLAKVLDANRLSVTSLVQPVPLGHKFAVADISGGDAVVKYGEVIGTAKYDIIRGTHVHVHNVASLRARS